MSLVAAVHPNAIQPAIVNAYTLSAFLPTTNHCQLPFNYSQQFKTSEQQHCPPQQHPAYHPYPLYKPLSGVSLVHLTHLNPDFFPSSQSYVSFSSKLAVLQPLLIPFPPLPNKEINNICTSLQIEKSLGFGAFGIVWSACDPRSGERVALKRIPHVFNNVIATKRAYRELYMLTNLNHLNVISLVDFILNDNFFSFTDVCLLTEYMDTDLHKIIVSPQILSPDHVKLFFYQILRGVKFLHSAGIIHRDLKPGNLLVNSNCLIKICDFGLARIDEPDCTFLTQEVITQYYRPPELLTGVTRYSFAVDMWSVGCIFAELLSRRILFQASTPYEQLERIVDFLGTPTCTELNQLPQEVRNFLQTIPSEYHSRVAAITNCQDAKTLLLALLRWEPESRLTAEEALRYAYVESGRARFHYTICNCCTRVRCCDNNNSNCGGGGVAADQQHQNMTEPSDRLEPICTTPLCAGFDANIDNLYDGKVKLWTLIHDYFARDQRVQRIKVNPFALNYRAFMGSSVAFRNAPAVGAARVWR